MAQEIDQLGYDLRQSEAEEALAEEDTKIMGLRKDLNEQELS